MLKTVCRKATGWQKNQLREVVTPATDSVRTNVHALRINENKETAFWTKHGLYPTDICL